MITEWPGVLDPERLNASLVETNFRVSDAARVGKWDEVFRLLDSDSFVHVNQWRVGGGSWFTPLHQAAWHGAPVVIVNRLLRLGAWRSLRNADGDRPIDIAAKRGHHHLFTALAVPDLTLQEQQNFTSWDAHLAGLIAERTRTLTPTRFRQVPTEILALDDLESLWVPYPGMYGGFDVSIYKNRLFVESWSRVVGGSGQAHVITERDCVLVDQGFV
ncbi:hypothetical protein ACQR35_02570 [Pseudarthrobacter sp. J1738]|uniref:hypothetical protein n=1 Tax=unclassified Pseudarthrobacter TaxID=2647000 RepID=UPI003D29B163